MLAFIGHGTEANGDYLLMKDSPEAPYAPQTGIHLAQLIKGLHGRYSTLDGLVVLIDTCSSGVGAMEAASKWVVGLKGTLRYVVLTAAAEGPAADGCFTKTLVSCLREGMTSVPGEYIRREHVRPVIRHRCPNQTPHAPAYDDEGLYFAKNAALAHRAVGPSWAGTVAAETIQHF